MKSFGSFRLDTANLCLWLGKERLPIAPKAYDVLRYLVENPGRLVTPDELLDKLWPAVYVNPEVLRKYILEIRKVLGDRPDKPEFIETVTKRGYRFIAPVVDGDEGPLAGESAHNPAGVVAASGRKKTDTRYLQKLVAIPILALIAAAASAAHFWLGRAKAPVSSLNANSIAVLPFVDMSPARDQEYFSDGLSEQLIHELAKVPGLKVVGRSSAFQFKGKNEDLRNVGRKLGVANVLEGSIRREGNHVRITAELIKASDGFQLWSQTYDREITDIFGAEDEIALATTDALQLKLLGSNHQLVPTSSRSANPQAYQAYLRANYFWGQGHSKDRLSIALDYVNEAIKLDPNYAPSWALRATLENRMAGFSLIDVAEGARHAHEDAERAIALDPNSALGYIALARTQNDYDWNWEGATASLAKAAELEPGSAEVIRLRSYIARQLGDLDEATSLYQQAVALEPLRTDVHLGFAYQLYVAGRYEEAKAETQKALELNPQAAFAHLTQGEIFIATRKPQQALDEMQKESSDWGRLTGMALAYHALSREQESNAALAELTAKHGSDSAYQVAQVYAFRGETDKSFSWLERAYKQRDGGLTDLKTDPWLKPLRRDPRFSQLMKRMRLPE